LAPNTKIPTTLQQQLQKATTDEQIQDIFIHWTIQQIQDLQKDNIHHFHLFTLNQTSTIMPILQTLHANK
ncbi:MAG TPA: methylenetetrahydrofolate reductase, partial [Planctomycetota bacterium]|nr:methylenetetrahydrofolate reductase [Planctomycetota bacterium]